MNRAMPAFAVIGRVNKGKSSIVSTLAEDDSIAIEREGGTTRVCREYPVRVDGRLLMTLIDTPGFQQAPRALVWLQEHEISAATRYEVVAEFVRAFGKTDEFVDECRLLTPILDGAAILYVVDGAKPFRRNYEAEMEILRWTGRPRMALINHIGDGDHSHEWRPALDQYFSIVRYFDAQNVTFEDRIRLFDAFREMHEPWRPLLADTLRCLRDEWERRQREAARIIASLLFEELTYSQEIVLLRNERAEDQKDKLEKDFHAALRVRERKARHEIEALFQHSRLDCEEDDLLRPVFEEDLFAESTWQSLGLSPKQLIAVGAVAGATFGAVIDAALGASSFLAGTLLGGAIGGGSALYYSAQRWATIDNLTRFLRGDNVVRIGPHRNPNFSWILLDRALLHYVSIRDRAHSRREKLRLSSKDGKDGYAARLDGDVRNALGKVFGKVRRKGFRDDFALRKQLTSLILQIIKLPALNTKKA
jgi:hypothetical protein